VKAGITILESLLLRKKTGADLIACPGCGRLQVNLYDLVKQVNQRIESFYKELPQYKEHPIKVAVMGCIVNGPGEASEADLGVAAGNKKGQIFLKGKVVETVKEEEIVESLMSKVHELYKSRTR
jgi:(E)-4-hydroxy-3-methylbut-2-enyl-diphosphate synthase